MMQERVFYDESHQKPFVSTPLSRKETCTASFKYTRHGLASRALAARRVRLAALTVFSTEGQRPRQEFLDNEARRKESSQPLLGRGRYSSTMAAPATNGNASAPAPLEEANKVPEGIVLPPKDIRGSYRSLKPAIISSRRWMFADLILQLSSRKPPDMWLEMELFLKVCERVLISKSTMTS